MNLTLTEKWRAVEEMANFGREMIERRRKRREPYIDPNTEKLVPGRAVVKEERPESEAGPELQHRIQASSLCGPRGFQAVSLAKRMLDPANSASIPTSTLEKRFPPGWIIHVPLDGFV